MKPLANDLSDLLQKYGPAMARASEDHLKPLYDPAEDITRNPEALEILHHIRIVEQCRTKATALTSGKEFRFYPSQIDKIIGLVLECRRHGGSFSVKEMGCGKTPMNLAATYALFNAELGGPTKPNFKALVMCPGHITRKWVREARWAIPGVHAVVVRTFSELKKFEATALEHQGPSVAVMSKESAKLGCDVDRPCAAKKHAYETRQVHDRDEMRPLDRNFRDRSDLGGNTLHARMNGDPLFEVDGPVAFAACPDCHEILTETDKEGNTFRVEWDAYVNAKKKNPRKCKCGNRLSTWARSERKGIGQRPHLDRYIQRKMRGFFDMLIADEIHELASAGTIQGNAFGTLAAACGHVLALTGTLTGGYAKDLHAVLWRLAPDLMRRRGFDLSTYVESKMGPIARNERAFTEVYGVLEHKVTRDADDDFDGSVQRGKQGRKKSYKSPEVCRPGISPNLFNHYLIGRASFMSLDELGPALPTIERIPVACTPGDELRSAYDDMDRAIQDAMKAKKKGKGGPSVLSTIRLTRLDAYLDKPWDQPDVTCPEYNDKGKRIGDEYICTPRDLGFEHVDAKDRKLVEICREELGQGRRCCVYAVFTGKHDVRPKIARILQEAGLRAVILPDSVEPKRRESWIENHLHEMDVLIVHPKKVMTGLDLIQFPSLIWYQIGFSTHVLRQASARARRPIQTKPCKVFFLYYEKTVQEDCLYFMGEKEKASSAIEGVFDLNSLDAMMNGTENADVLSSLAHRLEGSVERGALKDIWKEVDRSQNSPDPTRPRKGQAHTPTAARSRRPTKKKRMSSPASSSCSLAEVSLWSELEAPPSESAATSAVDETEPSLFDARELAAAR